MRIIGGHARGRRMRVPEGKGTRPPLVRLRQSLFSILGDLVEGSRVLDLFAGAGAFGIEALSRGAREAIFVERDPEAARLLAGNLKSLGFSRCGKVWEFDALETPSRLSASDTFELFFLDPPFPLILEDAGREAIIRLLIRLFESHCAPGGCLVIRYPSELDGKFSLPACDTRGYGKSMVSILLKSSAGQRWETDPA